MALALSARTISSEAAVVAGTIFLAMGAPAGLAASSALAAESLPAGLAASTVTGGGITLHSVSTDLPVGDRTFPGGAGADAINNNCLACHSAGMVLTQPSLSRSEWQGEVDKMRNSYKAPVAQEDVPAIVSYLANLSAGRLRGSRK